MKDEKMRKISPMANKKMIKAAPITPIAAPAISSASAVHFFK